MTFTHDVPCDICGKPIAVGDAVDSAYHEQCRSNMTVAFVDVETTGLDPDLHEIWEVALITDHPNGNGYGWAEQRWFLPVNLGWAHPDALRIGGYHKRHPHGYDFKMTDAFDEYISEKTDFAREFAESTRGLHIACAIPSFDMPRLYSLLTMNGACPEWHYHLICVESMLLGKYKIKPPWKSEDLLAKCGIVTSEEDKHTALGDARWVRDVYQHCMEGE